LAEIDFAVGASMAPLVRSIPYIHRTFALPRARIRQPWLAAYAEICNQTQLFQREIAGRRYDLAIAPRWDSADSFFSAYLAYLTGAPIRCGYSGTSDGGSPEVDRLLTIAATGGVNEHESLRYTRLLGRCGFEPREAISDQASKRTIRALTMVAQAFRARGVRTDQPLPANYVVFSPGATNGRRMWPIERFAEVGRALQERFGVAVIAIGSAADASICESLASSIGGAALSIAGKTDPLQMLDVIARAALFLGNDSGPAHIAGGLGIGTIVVSPFPSTCLIDHPNSARRFKPVGPHVEVLQPEVPLAPCCSMCQLDMAHCILQISSKSVEAVAVDLLNREVAKFPSTIDHPPDDSGA